MLKLAIPSCLRYGFVTATLHGPMMKKQLDEAVATAIVHTIDRVMDFFVRSRAAMLVWPDEHHELLALNSKIRAFWNSKGFTDEILDNRNLIANAFDLLQCNFCYDRSTAITKEDRIERRFDMNLREFLHYFKSPFQSLSFPILNNIRAAELIRPFKFELAVHAACNLFNTEFKEIGMPLNGETKILSEDMTNTISQLLHRYPIFLNPMARYFFIEPKDVGLKAPDLTLAFGATYDINAEDLISMLDDYKFHFLLARSYFAPNNDITRSKSNWEIMDQLAKAFVGKETRNNKYVSQKNSIAGSLCAMHVWELVYVERMTEVDAIRKVAAALGTADGASREKKVRDRFRTVEKLIEEIAKDYDPSFTH